MTAEQKIIRAKVGVSFHRKRINRSRLPYDCWMLPELGPGSGERADLYLNPWNDLRLARQRYLQCQTGGGRR